MKDEGPHSIVRSKAVEPTKTTEFDSFAQDYERMFLEARIPSGVDDYFSRYKIREFRRIAACRNVPASKILDFGSGIGKSIPYFREYFPDSQLICADVSRCSLQIAKASNPGKEKYCVIEEESIPLEDSTIDVAFSACVLHHIPQEQHLRWLRELHRVVRDGGLLVIFEHNPWNPLTRKVVNRCALDRNAVLLSAPKLSRAMALAGWKDVCPEFHLFLPPSLAFLASLEKLIRWLPMGAQYSAAGIKPLTIDTGHVPCLPQKKF